MTKGKNCYTCRFCKINSCGHIYCSLREKGGQCINYDKWESQIDILDKIRYEVLEYIDDVDIAYEICGIFDKYTIESEETK